MAETHRDEMEMTTKEDAVALRERADKLAKTVEDARRELDFIDESEGTIGDVKMALEMLDEAENDMVHLRRMKARVSADIDELELVEEDLE
jgi:hypothetical protein